MHFTPFRVSLAPGIMGTLGLGFLVASSPALAAGELHLYNWGDYINPEVLERFSDEYDVDVSLDTYGSNEEMLAKLQAGATGYDLVFPSVHMQDIMYQLDLLEPTYINQSEHFANIDPDFLRAKTDSEGEYCLPYAWGTVGILYNKNRVDEMTSWEDFFNAARDGKQVAILDDMREALGVALIVNGDSVNATDREALERAGNYLIERKPLISAFTYDSVPMVQSGDLAAAHYFVGGMMYVNEDPENLGYVIPEEGATLYQENICMLKTAPNKENAKQFMEFFLRPEIAALNTRQQMNGTPNVEARELLPDALKNSPEINPPSEVMDRLQIFEDLGRSLQLYDRTWTKVRTAE
ncbi:spermidine/putrescine ABC transporter substrate-binding protein [Litchfieldella qijiaojingensis]|uniref:Putrescine-binding periplasmic protein n=1 Tax=Litchfieldella qijiaojingensis TaxID=980347 RepID=A0ABQ2YNQ6_9GAMM|nr:spermidine/putrescine ABC transporter substrate-binding protein [Halomonas qijiaojingensis]GGX89209.1 spermidine/putrescine ABC transporter substrate-binding protein [Halomonas qijiaojingensis]